MFQIKVLDFKEIYILYYLLILFFGGLFLRKDTFRFEIIVKQVIYWTDKVKLSLCFN
jgi:hypothetical protein